jgi:hypothetical protein
VSFFLPPFHRLKRIVLTVQHAVHGHVKIHGLTVPEAVDRMDRQSEPNPSVRLLQGFSRLPVYGKALGTVGNDLSLGPAEDEPVRGTALDPARILRETSSRERQKCGRFGPVPCPGPPRQRAPGGCWKSPICGVRLHPSSFNVQKARLIPRDIACLASAAF